MLIRHYSLFGDGVSLTGLHAEESFGRKIERRNWRRLDGIVEDGLEKAVANNGYFRRFAIKDQRISNLQQKLKFEKNGSLTAFLGNSSEVMFALDPETVDAAVTSPPYYNAREYSQWENIYCYLFDMYNNARGVFRCLKPGGYYLYNIFDYFDNERNISLSAMGQKRMILSSYIAFLFETAGFKYVQNVVWDKGAIEGKRAFNGGNFSPYYQAPFNCWEHVMVFRKPGDLVEITSPLPRAMKAQPVIKMVKGENRHGHTAPFPAGVPCLITERLPTGSLILDPYAGSMTTAIAANEAKQKSICIEMNEDYYNLGLRKFMDATGQNWLK